MLLELQITSLISFWAVAAVPDGLKAWEILKGRPHNIDLILTEVDLPSISGYALLTLIMEHEICKNIPVISMIPWIKFYGYFSYWYHFNYVNNKKISVSDHSINPFQWCPHTIQLAQYTTACWKVLLTILLSPLGEMNWGICGSMFGEGNRYDLCLPLFFFSSVHFLNYLDITN